MIRWIDDDDLRRRIRRIETYVGMLGYDVAPMKLNELQKAILDGEFDVAPRGIEWEHAEKARTQSDPVGESKAGDR